MNLNSELHRSRQPVPARFFNCRLVLVLAALVFGTSLGANAAQESDNVAIFQRAVQHYKQNQFPEAIESWQSIVASKGTSKEQMLLAQAHLGMAESYQKMALYGLARQQLTKAEALVRSIGDAQLSAQYHGQLGNYYVVTEQHESAVESLAQAVSLAEQVENLALLAQISNDYANALSLQGYQADAQSHYQRSIQQALGSQPALALGPLTNLLKLNLERSEADSALQNFQHAFELSQSLPVSANELTALGHLASQYLAKFDIDQRVAHWAESWLQSAVALTTDGDNHRSASYAKGYLAKYYLISADNDVTAMETALSLTQGALINAHRARAPELSFRWEHQLAQIHQSQQQFRLAMDAYQQAITTLKPLRQELLSGYRNSRTFFSEELRPIYMDYIDLLFKQADLAESAGAESKLLRRAIDTLEALKSAEYQDYFRDQCVVAQEQQAVAVESVAGSAAVVYPVVLSDRVEVLLAISGEISKHTVDVDSKALNSSAQAFRRFAQDPSTDRYLPYSNRLYRWLVEPLRLRLASADVDTLVIVPDGSLRTLPFAALHDGDEFLAEQFALAVTPSMTLTAPKRLRLDKARVLLAGVSDAVQGYSPLPHVPRELEAISEQIGGDLLSNDEYTRSTFAERLRADSYSIVHMATHSTVGDSPEQSYLLTYDASLDMNALSGLLQLGRFRESPLELLTLSACETALGNERAALGFAGMALKSGARSVVASLWLIEDQATAEFMGQFYRQLQDPQRSKADALRLTQVHMLNHTDYRHPANWAAFVLIGNWL